MPNSKRRQQKVEADLQQLKGLIPGVSGDVSQIEIMHEAARYIDQLQNNLVCHIRTHGYPEKMRKEVVAKDRVNNNNSNSGGGGGGFEDSDSIKKNLDSYIASSSKSWPK